MSDADISGVVLRAPAATPAGLRKGVVLCNYPDRVLKLVPGLGARYWVVERRGWCGPSRMRAADVLLVDDIPAQVAWDRRRRWTGWLRTVLVPGARTPLRVWFGNADFVDTDRFRPRGRPKTFDAIMVARWDAWKRHDLFVAAVRALWRRDPSARAVLLGHFDVVDERTRQYRRRIVEEIQTEGLPIELPLLHAGTDDFGVEDIEAWIDASRTGLVLSQHEAINRSKMECLASDVPVIVCADSCWCVRKHVTETSGLVVPPGAGGHRRRHPTGEARRALRAAPLRARAHRPAPRHGGPAGGHRSVGPGAGAPAPLRPYDGRNETLMWRTFVDHLQGLLGAPGVASPP